MPICSQADSWWIWAPYGSHTDYHLNLACTLTNLIYETSNEDQRWEWKGLEKEMIKVLFENHIASSFPLYTVHVIILHQYMKGLFWIKHSIDNSDCTNIYCILAFFIFIPEQGSNYDCLHRYLVQVSTNKKLSHRDTG